MANGIASLSDADLITVATQMGTALSVAPPNYGLTVVQVGALTTATTDFQTALTDHATAQANAKSKTQLKNDQRTSLENIIRDLRDKAKANNTSDALMADLGLPPSGADLPPTATQPIGEVDTSERMRHTIKFYDQGAGGNLRRPRGTVGCEIWVKIGDPPPADEKDCTFLSLDTQSPYVVDYAPTDANKTAHYMLRWQLRDGSKGAWGETVSATITA